jgi:hypothetical protein
MPTGIVYLSHGRLFFKSEESPATEIDSEFAQSIRQRAFELHRRHAWKTQGRGAKFMSGGISGGALWGADLEDAAGIKIVVTGCAGGSEGDLFYALQSPEISGLFRRKADTQTEQRLLHTSDFKIGHIAVQRETDRLAMSLQHRGGATIAVMDAAGSGFTEVTQGESADESPQWFPGGENKIVFQSAGLAQNEQGQYVGRGPATIQSLDLDSGAMACLAEDSKFDLLGPKIDSDGPLYFIRRPYRGQRPRLNPQHLLEDILLFPFRLIYALFQYLNLLTMMYTGKPLARSGNAQQRYADTGRMMIWGNLIEARKSLLGNGEEANGLVPASWELCRKAADGNVEVLAKGVLAFDLENSSAVVYSNGAAIYRRDCNGKTSRIHKDSMIQQVISVSESVAARTENTSGAEAPAHP